MYPGLEPVVEVDQEELAKKYANCLKLIHLGNYLCTPKVDYSSERKCMLDLKGPNSIVVEQRSKKKSQKDSGIFVLWNSSADIPDVNVEQFYYWNHLYSARIEMNVMDAMTINQYGAQSNVLLERQLIDVSKKTAFVDFVNPPCL